MSESTNEGGQSAADRRRDMRVPWWRRNYMVNRELQLKFAGSAVVIGLSSSVVSAGMLLWAFYAFNIWQGQRLPTPILLVFGFVLLVNVAGIYFSTLMATSRIVGPLFNLLKQFNRLSRGDFSSTARFRKGDEIHYVARRFNEMVERLSGRDAEIFDKIDEAHKALQNQNWEYALECVKYLKNYKEQERDAVKRLVL